MQRRRRTEILIQGDSQLAQLMVDSIIEKYEYKEIVAPRYGLTMIKMRETAKNSLFYIGEAVVTEAKVEIQNEIGIGIVTGMKQQLAKHLAVIDAAYRANLPETKQWDQLLLKEEQLILSKKLELQTALSQTKVQFETMDVE